MGHSPVACPPDSGNRFIECIPTSGRRAHTRWCEGDFPTAMFDGCQTAGPILRVADDTPSSQGKRYGVTRGRFLSASQMAWLTKQHDVAGSSSRLESEFQAVQRRPASQMTGAEQIADESFRRYSPNRQLMLPSPGTSAQSPQSSERYPQLKEQNLYARFL